MPIDLQTRILNEHWDARHPQSVKQMKLNLEIERILNGQKEINRNG